MNNSELRERNKNRVINQICFVTDDYKRTIQYLTDVYQWGPWDIGHDTHETIGDVLEYGEVSRDCELFFACTMIGQMEIEVIQPVKGPKIFEKFLKEKGPGIHHFKEAVIPKEGFGKRIEELKKLGNRDCFEGGNEYEHYVYLDGFDEIGAFCEMSNNSEGNGEMVDGPGYLGQYPPEI